MNSSWRKCLENIVFNSEMNTFIKVWYTLPFRFTGVASQQKFVLVKTYWRRLEDDFKKSSVQHYFVFQDKTSWRRLPRLLKTPWRRFRKTYCKYVLKTSKTSSRSLGRRKVLRWRRLGKQEMFAGIKSKLRNLWLPSR